MKTGKILSYVVSLLATLASAFATQTVSNGKWWWWSGGNTWFYVNSSMGNILVDDGVTGTVLPSFYRRTGETINLEAVRDSSFVTGSYCLSDGRFVPEYQFWTDNAGGYYGKFAVWRWSDNTNNYLLNINYACTTCFNLQASNGQYMSAINGGGGYGIACNKNAAYAWEEFTMWAWGSGSGLSDGNQIVVGTRDNFTFLTAEGGGGQSIVDNRTAVGGWEYFTLHKVASAPGTPNDQTIRSGDQVALSASNGQYWSADYGGGGGITANRDGVGAWETFTITFVPPEPR